MHLKTSQDLCIQHLGSKIQYSCFLTYDAAYLSLKLSNAYRVEWKYVELETQKILPQGGSAPLLFQMLISKGLHKHMILITPHSGNNIFSDYLDAFGEGFHHFSILYEEWDEYQIELDYLIQCGYSKVQICAKPPVFESCIMKHPDAEFMLEIIFLDSSSSHT